MKHVFQSGACCDTCHTLAAFIGETSRLSSTSIAIDPASASILKRHGCVLSPEGASTAAESSVASLPPTASRWVESLESATGRQPLCSGIGMPQGKPRIEKNWIDFILVRFGSEP